jgi:hypothetical protein
MTKDEARKAAKVMEAWANGAVIQYSRNNPSSWSNISATGPSSAPAWDWYTYNYRVKPETKKFRVCLIRQTNGETRSYCVSSESEAGNSHFIKWLTDWIEYEAAE